MPSIVYGRIPRSAYDADKACPGRTVRLDSRTRLERNLYDRTIDMRYRGGLIVRWSPDGATRVYPPRNAYHWPAMDRIAAALPEFWTVDFRSRLHNGRRRRPRFVYRGVYTLGVGPLTFRADGGVQWSERDTTNYLSLEAIEVEAASIAGFATPRTRRRRVRPDPAYTTRATVSQTGGLTISPEPVTVGIDPPVRRRRPVTEEF